VLPSIDYFLNMTMVPNGAKVGSVKLLNGHAVLWKIPMPERTGSAGLLMPDQYRKRAVGNLCAIKGLLLKVSEPWTRKKVKTTWAFDIKAGQDMPTHTVLDDAHGPSSIQAGMCCLFNSYNVGHVIVKEMDDYLVIVREIDMEAIWSPDVDDDVELSSWAMSHGKVS
jgi:hypothetical protein